MSMVGRFRQVEPRVTRVRALGIIRQETGEHTVRLGRLGGVHQHPAPLGEQGVNRRPGLGEGRPRLRIGRESLESRGRLGVTPEP